jgi:hypothetical protein
VVAATVVVVAATVVVVAATVVVGKLSHASVIFTPPLAASKLLVSHVTVNSIESAEFNVL